MIGPLNQEVVAQHMTNGQIANALVLSDRRADPRATHPHQAPVPPQVLAWAEPGPRAEHIEPNRSTVWGPPGKAARLQNSHARIHSRGADRGALPSQPGRCSERSSGVSSTGTSGTPRRAAAPNTMGSAGRQEPSAVAEKPVGQHDAGRGIPDLVQPACLDEAQWAAIRRIVDRIERARRGSGLGTRNRFSEGAMRGRSEACP